MTHGIDLLGRSRYLELALSAQRLITGLVKARTEPGAVDDLAAVAKDGLMLLQSSNNTYHALRTLRQTKAAAPLPQRIEEVLRQLAEDPSARELEEGADDIDRIIDWFAVFQGHALGNFSSDYEPVPDGVRELWSSR